jgi:hypothetical protein
VERRTALSIVAALSLLPCSCSQAPQQEPPLTAEGKAYVRNLQLSDVGMKATESYAKQTLTEIEGNVKNAGNRVVNRVDVFCLFYDRSGVLVLRERVPMIKKTLRPGETRRFRLAFDDIPESWNNQLPHLVIAQVLFG